MAKSVIYNRTALKKLTLWANRSKRKPLILRGARQVGKTTLVRLFSKNFEQFISLDLEKKSDRELFERGLPVKDVYQSLLLRQKGTTGKRSLLFIDEIQNSAAAISLLRYFYEELPEVHVIAAGSLLEAIMDKYEASFPVGRVEYLFLYPFSFEEFLAAAGLEQALAVFQQIPTPDYAMPELLKLFHRYTLLGGMPEVLSRYLENEDVTSCSEIFQSLLVSYGEDIVKYAQSQKSAQVIRHCLEVAPYEIGKRIKFNHFGNSNYKSKDVGEALRTLERAMLIQLVYPSTNTELPILPDWKKHPKIQFLDAGLINYIAGLQQHYYEQSDLHAFYRGAMAEHIVLQEILATSGNPLHKPCFWVREKKNSNAELDGLMRYSQGVVPLEVKAGHSGRLKSLHLFMDSSSAQLAVRLSSAQFSQEEIVLPSGKKYQLLNIPYFHASKVEEYVEKKASND